MASKSETQSNPPVPPPPTAVSLVSVRFWINAFLPATIPGLTRQLSAGPHAGRTVVPGPRGSEGFLTDNRGFSNLPAASSRMHSEFEVRFSTIGPSLVAQKHRCDPSHEIDEATGGVVGTGTASTARMNCDFSTPRGELVNYVEVELKAEANNPLVKGSPDVEYGGTIVLDYALRRLDVDLRIHDFPAFEAYASINGGPGTAVFTEPVPKGGSPRSLLGKAKRPVRVRLEDVDGDGVFEKVTRL